MRSHAVQIFTNLIEVVCAAGEFNKGLVKELLGPSLLPFTEALVKHLQEPDGPTNDVGLKTSIVKGIIDLNAFFFFAWKNKGDVFDVMSALTSLVKHVPKQLSQWLLQILPTVWNTLTHSAHVYVACVVNETEEVEEQVDLDGTFYKQIITSLFRTFYIKQFFFVQRRSHQL
jgi:hypothetical protein